MKVLTIISHTEHYKLADGSVVGLGSTVTEINHLISVFDEIRHIAMLHQVEAPSSALPYSSKKIKFIPIKAVGGNSLSDKISVLANSPKVISTIKNLLRDSNYFQFRAPTGIGVYVIPYLILFSSKKGWFKYAGNWKQEHAPLAYRFQKWMLKRQKRFVTINGTWDDQPQQCLSFENPCLTNEEIAIGNDIRANKKISYPLEFCFVGRLEAAKGLDKLISAVEQLKIEEREKINNIHLVGVGEKINDYKKWVNDSKLPFIFHGFLSRDKVHQIYQRCHAIVLPSASEGFPKVIAEGVNYGCLPIVSNVSGISNYIVDGENGFLLDEISVQGIIVKLLEMLNMSSSKYSKMLNSDILDIEKFSYDYYNNRIKNTILD